MKRWILLLLFVLAMPTSFAVANMPDNGDDPSDEELAETFAKHVFDKCINASPSIEYKLCNEAADRARASYLEWLKCLNNPNRPLHDCGADPTEVEWYGWIGDYPPGVIKPSPATPTPTAPPSHGYTHSDGTWCPSSYDPDMPNTT